MAVLLSAASDDTLRVMFRVCLVGFACILVNAQESRRTTSATYDLHGRPVPQPTVLQSSSATGSRRTELVQSVNGRKVPVESVEERVVSEGGGVKIVERIVRRYDPNGRPGPQERILIEEQRSASGAATILESRYRTDINGREQLWERAKTETTVAGATTRSETVLERQGPNASLEFAEKKTSVATSTVGGSESDVVTFRRNESGRLYEAAREVTARTSSNGTTAENTATYEGDGSGRLRLSRQVVKRIHDQVDGTRTEVDIYSADVEGRAQGEPRLREQQVIERRPARGDGFIETISIRRPSVNEPGKAGRFEKVSETVCTGDCKDEQAPQAVSHGPST